MGSRVLGKGVGFRVLGFRGLGFRGLGLPKESNPKGSCAQIVDTLAVSSPDLDTLGPKHLLYLGTWTR